MRQRYNIYKSIYIFPSKSVPSTCNVQKRTYDKLKRFKVTNSILCISDSVLHSGCLPQRPPSLLRLWAVGRGRWRHDDVIGPRYGQGVLPRRARDDGQGNGAGYCKDYWIKIILSTTRILNTTFFFAQSCRSVPRWMWLSNSVPSRDPRPQTSCGSFRHKTALLKYSD